MRENNRRELQALSDKALKLESERASLEQEHKKLQSDMDRIQAESNEELRVLQGTKDSLETELARALERAEAAESHLEGLKEDLSEKQLSDMAEREKIQNLMARLEANSAALTMKQKKLDEQEEILNHATKDIDGKLAQS